MLEIQSLSGIIDLERIEQMTVPEANGSYQIYVPKSTQLYFSDSGDIAFDYAAAAYAGQRLREISSMFEYEFVPPEAQESILFTIRGVNPKQLANALLDISYQYVNDADDDMYAIEELNRFLNDAVGGHIELACASFIDIYKEFTEQSE